MYPLFVPLVKHAWKIENSTHLHRNSAGLILPGRASFFTVCQVTNAMNS